MAGEAPWEKDPVVNVGGSSKEPWASDPVVYDPNETGSPITNAWSDSAKEIRRQENDNPMLDKRLERRARLQGAGEAPNYERNGPASSFNAKGSLAPGAPVSNDFQDGPGAAGTWGLETAYTIGAAPLIEAGNAGYDALTGRGSFGDRYSHYQKKFDTLRDIGNEDHPYAGWAGTGTGIGGALLAPELKLSGAGTAGNAMLNGLVYGGLFGVGNPGSFGEAARNIGLGAGFGAGIGALAGKGMSMLENRLANRATSRLARQEYEANLAGLSDELGLSNPKTGGIRPYEAQGDIVGYGLADDTLRGSRGAGAQRVAAAAEEARPGAIAGAVGKLNEQIADGHTAFAHPTDAADALQHSVRGTVEGDLTGMRQGLDRMGQQLGRGHGLPTEADLGEAVTGAVRSRQAASKAGVNQAYANAAAQPGEFAREGVSRLSQTVSDALENGPNGPVPINEQTPRTADALKFLDEVSAMRGPVSANGAPANGEITGLTLNGAERVRQRLLALTRQAKAARNGPNGGVDYYAMRQVLDAYESHVDDMIQQGLFRGDDAAIQAWKDARATYRRHADLYSPRDRTGKLTEAGKTLSSIINDDRNPTEVANWLLGTHGGGESTKAMQLANHMRDILGADSPEFAAIKQAAWNRLTKLGENAAHGDAVKIADRIDELLSNRGRAFANALFNERERAALQSVSSGLRSIAARGGSPSAIKQLSQIASRDMRPEAVAQVVAGGEKALGSKDTLPLVRAIKQVYGTASPQWSAVRQTTLRTLLPTDQGLGPQALATRVRNFVSKNRTIANEVFTKEELAKIKGLGDILDRMVPPKGAVNNSGTAGKLIGGLMRKLGEIAGMAGWYTGDIHTIAASWLGGTLVRAGKDVLNAQTARQMFEGAQPMLPTRAFRAARSGAADLATPVVRETYRGLGPAAARGASDVGRAVFGSSRAAADENQ